MRTKMRNKIQAACILLLLASCGSHKTVVKDKSASVKTDKTDKSAGTAMKNSDIQYRGKQWVINASSLSQPSRGLQNRHISLWASHGRYFNNQKNVWEWQRPYIFCTTEDLFTQTIVVPYLIPMLQNAGANVFTPRERDWQPNEVIVDNDGETQGIYFENNTGQKWTDGGTTGFSAEGTQTLYGGSNPFTWGTTRKAKTSKIPSCSISYQPLIPEDGKYAVYVSYPTLPKSVTDAEYTVIHKGIKTVFRVNQQMGGGTWVYLGTFDFSKGLSGENCVVLSNASNDKGYVTADAVRFGGGMGNISRNGMKSGLPRCLEGARYYAQWAGAPDSVYNSKQDTDDYKDDINARSNMTNWLAGGSCYVPGRAGKKVPLDLSLAVHSDAGYKQDLKSLYGSLSICTTNFHDGKLASGLSRDASKEFAGMLLEGMYDDLSAKYGKWAKREIYDRNYSETRVPEIPSAIIETLSHQSFPDMIMAQDPNVKFTIARSIYKTILKFLSKLYDKSYTVSPLAPENVSLSFVEDGVVEITWEGRNDPVEPSAAPAQYAVYTAAGNNGFDNGEPVKGNKTRIRLSPGVLYRFKVTAINKGGESFPSETLSAVCQPGAAKSVLIVNGFERLSAPEIIDGDAEQGFDMAQDPGVTYGLTVGWSGKQTNFDKSKAGTLGPKGLGFGGSELEGKFIMGNTFDYTAEHAKAILSTGKYNVASASRQAVATGKVSLQGYFCIDYIAGLERYTSQSSASYKAFPKSIQTKLTEYTRRGGNILVSGAYINSDSQSDSDRSFMANVLHVSPAVKTKSATVNGMGTQFDIYSELNPVHYAATSVDVVPAAAPAFCTLTYADGTSACVAYPGKSYRTIAMGFPFECIKSDKKKASIMRGLLSFLEGR